MTFGERDFPCGCDLRIDSLAPWGGGVELRLLVERLAAFPDARSWSARLRRPLLNLPEQDADLLRSALAAVAGTLEQHLGAYRSQAAKGGGTASTVRARGRRRSDDGGPDRVRPR